MRILVLGASGMLGSSVLNVFCEDSSYEAWGTLRSESSKRFFKKERHSRLISGIDVLDQDALVRVLEEVKPDAVINCVGLIKQLAHAHDPLSTLPVNAMFPHRLAQLCSLMQARLVHISTDCVFSGRKGMYRESDLSDAEDLYGKSKFIGELHNRLNAITLRTSIIGHELNSHLALVEWFLAQKGPVKGYSKAIFSGLPTVELALIIKDYVIKNPQLHGLYHVAASPVSKLDLLRLVSARYGKNIQILPDENVVIDRSLNEERFRVATGYIAPAWPELIKKMYDDNKRGAL
ncbi:SDR family oxidoreductase [Pseudomonas sp. Q11]|uniref:dTDP-4-dehydrorhamnose reductase family protein n=1 Tax=Pseudomonas sp. Q11 TaxID=2968470 RepID=UPI0021093F4B|nr:SDR family oxidoreductase [Pseudomonas sp. Q11]MCQ6258019.1 SDR family oxidoreductase [Pseudomonas sp. Q11]